MKVPYHSSDFGMLPREQMAQDQEDYRHMYTHRGFTDAFEVLYTSMQCVIQRLQVGSLFSLRMTISLCKPN